MNRKGLVGLAAFGVIAVIFALTIFMAVVVMKPAESLGGSDVTLTTNITSLTSPHSKATLTFYVINANVTNTTYNSKIFNLTIVLPAGFAFIANTNFTNVSGMNFTNFSPTLLNWMNVTAGTGVNNTNTGWFQVNASIANYSGIYNFSVRTVDEQAYRGNSTEGGDTPANVYNMAGNGISVNVQPTMGKTDWSYCGPKGTGVANTLGCIGPGINNTGSFFFYDGNNVTVVINITDASLKLPVQNLSVLVNFTEIGNNTFGANSKGLVPATYNAGNGTYYAIGTVNFTNASTFIGSLNNNLKPAFVRILVDSCKGSSASNCNLAGANTMNSTAAPMTVALLVNMSFMGCPPADDAQSAQMWSQMPAMPYQVSGSNTSMVNPSGCVKTGDSLNSSITDSTNLCTASMDNVQNGFPPLVYNGSRYLFCAPNFAWSTTNFSQWAQERRNMSSVYLTFDIPWMARINFTEGVDFTSPDSMQGIMEFAMKALMSGGSMGLNESEFDGSNASGRAKPKLNISAELTIYNITKYGFGPASTMTFGSYNGTSKPTSVSACPLSRCTDINLVGGGTINQTNMTFTVSTWSTYVIGSTNYSLQFANLTGVRQATLPANTSRLYANATFRLNITNIGNSTETYNLTALWIPECLPLGGRDSGCVTFNTSSANGTFITLDANASSIINMSFTANSTSGTYVFGINANLHTGANVTNFSWNLNSTGDGINWTVTVSPFRISVATPTNTSNVSTATNLVFGLVGNVSTIRFANITANGSTTGFNSTLALGVINFSINSTTTVNLTAQGWMQLQNVTVWVNDTFGNANSTTVHFVVDNVAPNIHNMTTNGVYANSSQYLNYSNASVVLNLSADDISTGAQLISLVITNISNIVNNLTNLTQYINSTAFMVNWTATLNPNNYRDGYYNLSFIAHDFAGNVNNTNSSTGASNLTGRIAIDRQPPNVTIQKTNRAGNLIINSSLQSFNVTAADIVTQVYMVIFNLTNNSGAFGVNTTVALRDNATNGMVSNYSVIYNLVTLQDGNYTLKVIANDTMNNVNLTENVTFTVDNSPPGITSWNYSLTTKQLTILFNESIDNASVDLSKFNVTYDDGTGLLFTATNYSLQGATVHPNSVANRTVLIINLTSNMDTQMRTLQAAGEGKITLAAGAINDTAGNRLVARNNLSISTWNVYGIEISLTTSIWGSFNLPLTTLQNRSSLSSNYSADNVLASIRGNYAGIYYYSSGSWASYVPGRAVNTFTTFSDDTSTNNYWVYMTASDKLQIT